MHDVHDSWHFINASSTWSGTGKGREGKGKGGGVEWWWVFSFLFFPSSSNPWFDLRSHTLYELGNKRNLPHHPPPHPPGLPERANGGFQEQNLQSFIQHPPPCTEQRRNRKKNWGSIFFFLDGDSQQMGRSGV